MKLELLISQFSSGVIVDKLDLIVIDISQKRQNDFDKKFRKP